MRLRVSRARRPPLRVVAECPTVSGAAGGGGGEGADAGRAGGGATGGPAGMVGRGIPAPPGVPEGAPPDGGIGRSGGWADIPDATTVSARDGSASAGAASGSAGRTGAPAGCAGRPGQPTDVGVPS